MTQIRWRKSSRSGGGNTSCVEVAHTLAALRDSKNPQGPTLTVNVPALLTHVQAGHFNR
jgi:hypothetical protein